MVPTDGWDVVVDGWFPVMVGMLWWMHGSHHGWDVVVDGWSPLMVGML